MASRQVLKSRGHAALTASDSSVKTTMLHAWRAARNVSGSARVETTPATMKPVAQMKTNSPERRWVMNRTGYLLALCLAAAGCAQNTQQSSPDAGAAPKLSVAANPDLPQGVPGWKQGMSDAHASSPLAPHAAKMTVTPESEIPVSN